MINERHKLLFVHIIKTGGSSMHKYLKQIGGTKHDRFHTTLEENLNFNLNEYKKYRKFSIVRNPWDRVLSAYTFYKSKKSSDFLLKEDIEFNDWIKIIYDKQNRYLTCHNLNIQWLHLGNQYDWLTNHHNEIDMDFILRFENINEDFDRFTEKFNLPQYKFPHERKSDHEHYTTMYNNESIDIVSKFCKKDIEYFEYCF